jgi:hypothetical protein
MSDDKVNCKNARVRLPREPLQHYEGKQSICFFVWLKRLQRVVKAPYYFELLSAHRTPAAIKDARPSSFLARLLMAFVIWRIV